MNTRPVPFDELDRKIVTALMANARTSFAEIGAAVGLSSTAVKRRVDRLRETGVITGFTAKVDPRLTHAETVATAGPWRVVRLTDPRLAHGAACVGH